MPQYQGQPFSCENPGGRFHTDISKHFPHAPLATTRGSALPTFLIKNADGGTLWLEHVIDTNGGWAPLWFMWYSKNGEPRLSMSATFDIGQLKKMTSELSTFLETN